MRNPVKHIVQRSENLHTKADEWVYVQLEAGIPKLNQ